MGAILVIIANIFREQPFQMSFIQRDNMIEQISPAAFDPTLRLWFAKTPAACKINT
jgi:hypothetical protein